MIYALTDGSFIIRRPHLDAALAIWDYVEASVRLIFGDVTGDGVADRIMRALRDAGEMSDTEIHALFHRNVKASRIAVALDLLVRLGLVTSRVDETDGRPRRMWRATKKTN